MTGELAATVAQAIVELEEDYGVDVEPLADGGAIVTVRDIKIGPRWTPETVDICFQLPYNYPFAAIYPYYATAALARTDGGGYPNALQQVAWRERQVIQISLRANRWDPHVDTARGAIGQVARWFKDPA